MRLYKLLGGVLCALALAQLARAAQTPASSSGAAALITSTRTNGNIVAVTASIPAGNHQVTLQTRGPGGGAWVPRSVLRVNGKARRVVLTFAKTRTPEAFRVWLDRKSTRLN